MQFFDALNSKIKFKRAVKRCEVLRDPKNVFAPCQAKVDPATFYENCVWDQCATKLDDQGLSIVLPFFLDQGLADRLI